jgi:hypothetical protein
VSNHGIRLKSIAMSIEWLDDIMRSNFWVKCKDRAGVATRGTAKVSPFASLQLYLRLRLHGSKNSGLGRHAASHLLLVSPPCNIRLCHHSRPLVLEVARCCPKRVVLSKLAVVVECAVTMLPKNTIVATLWALMEVCRCTRL